MTPFLTIEADTPEATEAIGKQLAQRLRLGDLITLSAPLGAGKTVLVRGLVRALNGAAIDVPSPTFTLVQSYPDGAVPLTHADLYRLEDPAEIMELGLEEALDAGAVVIEWPELGEGYLPGGALAIEGRQKQGEGREWLFCGGEAWQSRLEGMSAE